MNRTEMIQMLLENLKLMNQAKINTEEFTTFYAKQEVRYTAMTDLQLQNICMMNFF